MTLSNKVLQFSDDVEVVRQVTHGGPDVIVQTLGGPVPSLARVVSQAQSILAELAVLGPELAAPGGAGIVRLASGETVQDAISNIQSNIDHVTEILGEGLTTDRVAEGEGENHYFTEARALASKLGGLSFINGEKIASTDTLLAALGKLQKQISNMVASMVRPGDIVLTARTDYIAPAWLPCDGAIYGIGLYPELDAILGAGGFESPVKLSDPIGLTTGVKPGISYSPDSQYVAMGAADVGISIYKRAGDIYTRLADPATLPRGWCRGSAFSPDGLTLAVSHDNTPYLTIYSRNGDVFTAEANRGGLGSTSYYPRFSPDGVFLAVGTNNASNPSLVIYKRIVGTSKYSTAQMAVTQPPHLVYSLAWSPDGTTLVVAGTNSSGDSKNLSIYSVKDGNITYVETLTLALSSVVYALDFSPDSKTLIVGYSNGMRVMRKVNGIFRESSPIDLMPTDVRSLSWHPSGAYLAVGQQGGTPKMMIYRYSGEALTRMPDPPVLGDGFTNQSVVFSPDGKHLAASFNSNQNYLIFYKGQEKTLMPNLVGQVKAKYFIKTGQ